jgi:hypothetical protein
VPHESKRAEWRECSDEAIAWNMPTRCALGHLPLPSMHDPTEMVRRLLVCRG